MQWFSLAICQYLNVRNQTTILSDQQQTDHETTGPPLSPYNLSLILHLYGRLAFHFSCLTFVFSLLSYLFSCASLF